MRRKNIMRSVTLPGMIITGLFVLSLVYAQTPGTGKTSYAPVDIKEDFTTIMTRMKAAKVEVMKRQMGLLNERYDLSNRPASGVTMSRGKPIQEGVRVKLPPGVSWEQLGAMSLEEIREKGLFPEGVHAPPAPQPSRGRHGVSAVPHRLRDRRPPV